MVKVVNGKYSAVKNEYVIQLSEIERTESVVIVAVFSDAGRHV